MSPSLSTLRSRWLLAALSLAAFAFAPLPGCVVELDGEEGAVPEQCDDGDDNDGDGLIDCEDPSCDRWSVCEGDDDDDDTADDDDDTADDDDDASPGDWPLCINEFMAANATTIPDETEAYPDWIELFNLTDDPIDLGGYTITDDLDDPTRHVLAPGLEIPAGGYLLLWADGLTELGPQHLSFGLAQEGEELGLYYPGGTAINHLEYDTQATDWSAARMPDGELDAWEIDTTPTPGQPNE